MKKIFLSIFILLLLMVSLTGCTTHMKTDITEEFDEYLDFSLGDYEIIEVTNKEHGKYVYASDFRYGTTKYKEWTIHYKNYLGETKEIKIDNDKNTSNDYYFYEQIHYYIKELAKSEYEKININIDSNYFNCTERYVYWSYKEWIENGISKSISDNIIEKTKKIKLSEFDILKLKEYEIKTSVSVDIEMITEVTDVELKTECIHVFDQYAEIFGKDYLDITFSWGNEAEPKYTSLSYNNEYIWR